MQYTTVPGTDLSVPRICIGTVFRSGMDTDRCCRALERAFERGCHFLDTANIYKDGRSEELIGRFVKGRRDRFILTTKVGMQTDDRPPLGPGTIEEELESSLRRLQTDYVDFYLCHQPDPRTPIAATLEALDGCVRQGKVRYAGVSNFAAWQWSDACAAAQQAHGWVPVCNQIGYSLLDRRPEDEIIPFCREHGLALTAYCTTFIGLLSGAYRHGQTPHPGRSWRRDGPYKFDACLTPAADRVVTALIDSAARHGVEPAQIAMAWCLRIPEIVSVITGADTPERVDANLRALDVTLTDADLDHLSTESHGMRMCPRVGTC